MSYNSNRLLQFTLPVVFFIGIGCQLSVLGQSNSLFEGIGIEQHVGKLIKIHGTYPPNDISYTQRLDLRLSANPDSSWNYLHGRAVTGFTLNHSTFGNQRVLGRGLSLAYHAVLHRRLAKNVQLFFNPSGGIAWFDRPYHIEDNPENLVIGSALTAMATAQVGVELRLKADWQMKLGGSFYHYSNSHFAVPNVGANVFGGFLGFHYSPGGLPASLSREERIAKGKKPTEWRPMIRLRMGMHEFAGTITPRDGPLYRVFGMTLGMSTTSESRAMWTFGATYDYYEAYANYIASQQLFDDLENLNWLSSTVAIFGGREWCFGRLHFFAELSAKVHSPTQKALLTVWDLPRGSSYDPYVDARIGYRYHLVPKNRPWHAIKGVPNVAMAIKTNGGAADFLEVSLGHTF